MKKIISAALLTFATCAVNASIVPVGVHNDVDINTVTNTWGWTQLYRGNYGANISVADMFAGHGNYVMLGGINNQLNTIDVLAAVSWDDFMTYTAQNQTHEANGALWYNNGSSLGFAGLGDTIFQTSADAQDVFIVNNPERDRLSWHTSGAGLAEFVNGGWRSGNNLWLNGSSDWDRIIFTTNATNNVPEPANLALLMAGMAGFKLSRKKFKANSLTYKTAATY